MEQNSDSESLTRERDLAIRDTAVLRVTVSAKNCVINAQEKMIEALRDDLSTACETIEAVSNKNMKLTSADTLYFVELGHLVYATALLGEQTKHLMTFIGQATMINSDISFQLQYLWLYVDASIRFKNGSRSTDVPDCREEQDWDAKSRDFGKFEYQILRCSRVTEMSKSLGLWSPKDHRAACQWFKSQLQVVREMELEECKEFFFLIDPCHRSSREERLLKDYNKKDGDVSK